MMKSFRDYGKDLDLVRNTKNGIEWTEGKLQEVVEYIPRDYSEAPLDING